MRTRKRELPAVVVRTWKLDQSRNAMSLYAAIENLRANGYETYSEGALQSMLESDLVGNHARFAVPR